MRKDWVEVKLSDVGEIFSGGTPKTKNEEYWGDEISWISPSDLSKYYNKFISRGRKSITELGLSKSSAKLIPAGSILFSSRAPIGYVVIANNDLATNQGFKSIYLPPFVFNEYVYYYLKASKNLAERNASGTTFKEISKRAFSELPFPLAPLPEQRAIVAKIEELFSDLDKGIADLKKAQEQLKIYRQAVLKKAFEGNNYKIRFLKDVVEKVQIGPFGSQLHKADYVSDGIPLINPIHIQNGEIKPNINYLITTEKRDGLPNYILQEGDVIMGRRGEMGRSALVTNKEAGWFCGTGSLYLRPNPSKLFSAYLNKYIQSATVKGLLTGSAKGTTMMNLNKKIITSLPIPIPSIREQHQIVQEIESRLSVCDKVEQSISESLEKAKALRQSILKKAFAGSLLSAEEIAACKAAPDYEPASVLLKKIKAEKAGERTQMSKSKKVKR